MRSEMLKLCEAMIRLGLLTVIQTDEDRRLGGMTFTVTPKGRRLDDEDMGDDESQPPREHTEEAMARRFLKILKRATTH